MPFRAIAQNVSADQVANMREKCLCFLEDRGLRIDSAKLLTLLAERGVRVDADDGVARFPRSLVDEAISTVPNGFTLAAPDARFDLRFPNPQGDFYFRTGTGSTSWLDPETNEYRPVTLNDVALWSRLASRLDNVDFVAFPSPDDAPRATTDVHALFTVLCNSRKHVWIQPYAEETVGHLIALSQAAAGGAESLRARPIVSIIACSLTPFAVKAMDAEVLIQATQAGIPIHVCSLPTAGGTAPVTESGTVLVHGIEILAMTVIAQLLKPGHPVIGTPLAFTMDMQTGQALQSSPEAMRIAAASVQLVKALCGIPAHTYGAGSDSSILDQQVPAEAAMLATLVALAGADILGAGGQFDVASSISPVQLVCDDEMVGALHKVVSQLKDDDETMGWQAILDTMPVETFLGHDHTCRHCREAWRARIYAREPREGARAGQRKDLWGRATDKLFELLQAPTSDVVGEDRLACMAAVLQQADQELAG
jgi:trimethylamine:corrinoid methyltransferase-like protein